MTESTAFWSLLDRTYPAVQDCWDRTTQTMDKTKMERLLTIASHDHRHMALFFRDLWAGIGSPIKPFDLIDAILVLERDQAQIVRDWVDAPFWP